MAKTASPPLPLLYRNPVPLDVAVHGKTALARDLNMMFCRNVHAVPVNLIEMPQLCQTYPIVFSSDETATPVAILGLTEQENLFVDDTGAWIDAQAYIPSYIRRYPFIFAATNANETLTLCIDAVDGILDAKSDMTLFGDDGKPSALTHTALEFCKSFHGASLQTRDFSAALMKSGLLVNREAEIPLPGGKTIRFGGFSVIDDQKWAALDEKTLAEWKNRGWLSGIYAHLFSAQQWVRLSRLYAARHAMPPAK